MGHNIAKPGREGRERENTPAEARRRAKQLFDSANNLRSYAERARRKGKHAEARRMERLAAYDTQAAHYAEKASVHAEKIRAARIA